MLRWQVTLATSQKRAKRAEMKHKRGRNEIVGNGQDNLSVTAQDRLVGDGPGRTYR